MYKGFTCEDVGFTGWDRPIGVSQWDPFRYNPYLYDPETGEYYDPDDPEFYEKDDEDDE